MATRQNYYAEVDSESNSSSATYIDKTTLSFTPDDNGTYIILATWQIYAPHPSYICYSKLVRTTGTPKDFNEILHACWDWDEGYWSIGCVAYETFGASPGSQTYKIQYHSDGSNSQFIQNARIIAIKATANDKMEQSESRSTTTSTSWQDKTTLIFTPGTQGDYIILASATYDASSNTRDTEVQLDIDATGYNTLNSECPVTDHRNPWMMMKRVNLDATEHTIKIQYATENSQNTAGIAHARILALRADEFANNYYTEDDALATTTEHTWQTRSTLQQTMLAQDYMIIGASDHGSVSTNTQVHAQLQEDTTSKGEVEYDLTDTTTERLPHLSMYKKTLSAQQYTWVTQWKGSGSTGNVIRIWDSRISVAQLTDTAPSGNVPTAMNSYRQRRA